MKNKKIFFTSLGLVTISTPLFVSASCLKSKAQREYEKTLKSAEEKANELTEKFKDNLIKTATITAQKEILNKIKNTTYKNDEEYEQATKNINLVMAVFDKLI